MTEQPTDPDLEQPTEPEPEGAEQPADPDLEQPADPEPEGADPEPEDEGETFTRDYVHEIRREAARYRTRAAEAETEAETLRDALWTARVAATGRLMDPADLPRPEGADLEPETVAAAVDALLEQRPHYGRRRITGRIGQGEGVPPTGVSLSGLLRGNT